MFPGSLRNAVLATNRGGSRVSLHAGCAIRRSTLPLVALVACVLAAPVSAADPPTLKRAFAEFGQTGYTAEGEDQVMQAGMRLSTLDTDGPSLDFAFAGWLAPAVVVTGDLDLAWPIGLGRGARLVPRAGASTLLFGGGGFGGAVAGGNLGIGLVLAPAAPLSLRLDYTIRRFLAEELNDEGELQSVTVGIAW